MLLESDGAKSKSTQENRLFVLFFILSTEIKYSQGIIHISHRKHIKATKIRTEFSDRSAKFEGQVVLEIRSKCKPYVGNVVSTATLLRKLRRRIEDQGSSTEFLLESGRIWRSQSFFLKHLVFAHSLSFSSFSLAGKDGGRGFSHALDMRGYIYRRRIREIRREFGKWRWQIEKWQVLCTEKNDDNQEHNIPEQKTTSIDKTTRTLNNEKNGKNQFNWYRDLYNLAILKKNSCFNVEKLLRLNFFFSFAKYEIKLFSLFAK